MGEWKVSERVAADEAEHGSHMHFATVARDDRALCRGGKPLRVTTDPGPVTCFRCMGLALEHNPGRVPEFWRMMWDQEIGITVGERDALKAENAELRAELSALDEIRNERDDAQEKQHEAEVGMDELRAELETAQHFANDWEAVNQVLAEARIDLAAAREQLAALDAELQDTQAAVGWRDEQIAALEKLVPHDKEGQG